MDNFNFKGHAIICGNDIDTDAILPAEYQTILDPHELAKHCMENEYPGFYDRVQDGDILVAGRNFGCGSSREQAPLAIQYSGISCIIAPSFARLFYRNAINLGFPIMELPECVDFQAGDEIEANPETGTIRNLTQGTEFKTPPMSEFVMGMLKSGGLLAYVENRAKKEGLIG